MVKLASPGTVLVAQVLELLVTLPKLCGTVLPLLAWAWLLLRAKLAYFAHMLLPDIDLQGILLVITKKTCQKVNSAKIRAQN